ncbi:MAG: 6-phosphogluconolactonase [Henriciella sp.]|nr:6-phosphogluconolactonase [Henriciella sp.]
MKTGIKFETFSSKAELQAAAAAWIIRCLNDALNRRGQAQFYASGGSTPGPIYQQMQGAELNWSDIQIGLSDERWVDETHPGSNAAMVRRTLLQGPASAARFVPMKVPGADPFEAVAAVEALYRPIGMADVLLAGMGPDSHTLSWFPGGRGYEESTDPASLHTVAALEAIESDVTGPNTLRMTLTYPVVAEARAVLLLITGKEKRHVFETAVASTPIAKLVKAAGDALTVFYSD